MKGWTVRHEPWHHEKELTCPEDINSCLVLDLRDKHQRKTWRINLETGRKSICLMNKDIIQSKLVSEDLDYYAKIKKMDSRKCIDQFAMPRLCHEMVRDLRKQRYRSVRQPSIESVLGDSDDVALKIRLVWLLFGPTAVNGLCAKTKICRTRFHQHAWYIVGG